MKLNYTFPHLCFTDRFMLHQDTLTHNSNTSPQRKDEGIKLQRARTPQSLRWRPRCSGMPPISAVTAPKWNCTYSTLSSPTRADICYLHMRFILGILLVLSINLTHCINFLWDHDVANEPVLQFELPLRDTHFGVPLLKSAEFGGRNLFP